MFSCCSPFSWLHLHFGDKFLSNVQDYLISLYPLCSVVDTYYFSAVSVLMVCNISYVENHIPSMNKNVIIEWDLNYIVLPPFQYIV